MTLDSWFFLDFLLVVTRLESQKKDLYSTLGFMMVDYVIVVVTDWSAHPAVDLERYKRWRARDVTWKSTDGFGWVITVISTRVILVNEWVSHGLSKVQAKKHEHIQVTYLAGLIALTAWAPPRGQMNPPLSFSCPNVPNTLHSFLVFSRAGTSFVLSLY